MPAFFYIKHRAQASDFRSFGRLLMGASFPKTPPKVRQGFVRKRERHARPRDKRHRPTRRMSNRSVCSIQPQSLFEGGRP